MSTDDEKQNVYLGVVVRVYHYPREVLSAAIATFWRLSGCIRLLLVVVQMYHSPHGDQ